MILWQANSGAAADLRAKELLAEVADDDPALHVCNDRRVSHPREDAFDTLWMVVWPNLHQGAPVPGPVPRTDLHQCSSPRWGWLPGWCGAPAGQEGWYVWSYFCSEECRIRSLCEDTFRLLGDNP